MSYRVVLTAEAKQLLAGIQDRREQNLLLTRLEQLAESPEQQGKPLRDDLAGYRSIRAIGQRYRIVYQIFEKQVLVVVVAMGRRKDGDQRDVYELASKLVKVFQVEQFLADELPKLDNLNGSD
jgi:mRNA interferase RelE/StbE